MQNLPGQIIENVFPEERSRLFSILKEQKRHIRSWLLFFTLLGVGFLAFNFVDTLVFVLRNPQLAFNWIAFFWIVTIVIVPFVWPQKPGDFFSETFGSGVNPRIWEYDGGIWKVELDESGKPVLSVTNSEHGGLVTSCLSWADYELRFETRILNECTAWIVRASNLNNYVMFQLRTDLIRPHKRSTGIWIWNTDLKHNLPIKVGEWYSIRTMVRGVWAQVYVTVDGKENLIFQDSILGTQGPVNIQIVGGQTPNSTLNQIIESSFRLGSFGFRLAGSEKAQFRNLAAYKL